MNAETSTDYWIETGLTQPKAEIADYVESMGTPVPRRFKNLEEAIGFVAGGGEVLMRSEHPGDYVGASGLMDSMHISQGKITQGKEDQEHYGVVEITDELISKSSRAGAAISPKKYGGPGYYSVQNMIIGNITEAPPETTLKQLLLMQELTTQIVRYAMYLGENPKDFMDQSSYSFWEYVPGTNVAVYADDVNGGQYHVLTAQDPVVSGKKYTSYDAGIVNAGGEVIKSSDQNYLSNGHLTPDLIQAVTGLYEAVRGLPRFADNHCPIIELQIDTDGTAYFLQSHRGRDFSPSASLLGPNDYPQQEGWRKAAFVRGAVGELATVKTAMWYPDHLGFDLPSHEEGSFDFGYDFARSDVLTRRRTAYFCNRDFDDTYQMLAAAHGPRIKWLLPQVAMTLGHDGFSTLFEEGRHQDKMLQVVVKNKQMARLVLDIASDGTDGYVRINPDAEQPVLTDY